MGKRSPAFAMLVVVAVLGNMPGILGDISECKGNVFAIVIECQSFVRKEGPQIEPSKECCAALKDADLPCLCKYLAPDIEALISMEKAVYVARTCGRYVPAGAKGGNYTVPPVPPPEP